MGGNRGGTMKNYSLEFKVKVLRYIFVDKYSRKEACKEFDIPAKTLDKWITKYHKGIISIDGNDLALHDVSKNSLTKEIRRLERENEILKKTIILLAKKE